MLALFSCIVRRFFVYLHYPYDRATLRTAANGIETGEKSMLDARIATERQLENMPSAIRKMYKRVPFVYAHGRLETDFGTDIFYVFKGDSNICNGLIAYTQDCQPVKFHLYKHPRAFEMTGVVTYCNDDKDANDFGKRIVEQKPERF